MSTTVAMPMDDAPRHAYPVETPDAEAPQHATLVAPAMGSMPINITYADAKADHAASELSLEGLSLGDRADPWENRVREAADNDGESFVTVGPMPANELASMLTKIEQVAITVGCDCTVVHEQERADKGGAQVQRTAFLVVRKLPSQGHHLDLRVAVVGNVDAGKSTLVGVLTGPTTFLDDGRGLARSRVLRHKHEADTGRTSSIAEDQHMRLDAKGQCLAVPAAR